jgi:hypothetical protein
MEKLPSPSKIGSKVTPALLVSQTPPELTAT